MLNLDAFKILAILADDAPGKMARLMGAWDPFQRAIARPRTGNSPAPYTLAHIGQTVSRWDGPDVEPDFDGMEVS